MSQIELLNNEYALVIKSIQEYQDALRNSPDDWILRIHLSRAKNRKAFLESELFTQAA